MKEHKEKNSKKEMDILNGKQARDIWAKKAATSASEPENIFFSESVAQPSRKFLYYIPVYFKMPILQTFIK